MQRRMPSGQGPARRSKPRVAARGAVSRTASRSTSRTGSRTSTARASRPALARRVATGAAAGSAKRTLAPRPRQLTGRATVLFVVLAALALGYAYPVRVYLSQRAEISRMESGQAEQRRHIDELSDEVAKWQDDAYVVSQARTRIYMFYPGEIPLLVLWDEAGAARDAGVEQVADQSSPDGPWYGRLWSSIEVANQ